MFAKTYIMVILATATKRVVYCGWIWKATTRGPLFCLLITVEQIIAEQIEKQIMWIWWDRFILFEESSCFYFITQSICQKFKTGKVVPVFKVGEKTPISLTQFRPVNICAYLKRLNDYLFSNNIIIYSKTVSIINYKYLNLTEIDSF